MLNECKLAVRVTHAMYEPELCSLMDAAAKDLTIAGIVIPGTVSFAQTENGMVDNSTLTDALVMRAIFTYVRAHFGSPPDYDKLVEAYDTQKVQLMHATGYTDYGEEEPETDQPETGPVTTEGDDNAEG
jgi:hypothetical protein